MKDKPNNDKKEEPKIIGSFIINVFDNNTTSATFPKNINPGFLRNELHKYLDMVSDECIIQKVMAIEQRKKILAPNGLSIPNLKING